MKLNVLYGKKSTFFFFFLIWNSWIKNLRVGLGTKLSGQTAWYVNMEIQVQIPGRHIKHGYVILMLCRGVEVGH